MRHVKVKWSEEDQGFIAVDTTRPGCSAWGKTELEALRELMDAQDAWDQAHEDD